MDDNPPEPGLPGELARGTPVSDYKVREQIGAGPTGTVYSAIHPLTGDRAAVKVIHGYLTQDRADWFLEHLEPVVRLEHPRIVPLLDRGQLDDGAVYMVSEFVLGQPLSDVIRASAPLTVAEAVPLLLALCEGLGVVHEAGLVHGNLNPDNIWLTPQESGAWPPRLRLMDLGGGQLLDPEDVEDGPVEDRLPYYLSPEQCRGEAGSASTDIYAAGVVAYQLMTGRLPFSSARPAEVWRMHLEEAPPADLLRAKVHASVAELLLKALEKDPARRFKRIEDLTQELEWIPLDEASASPEEAKKEEPEEAKEEEAKKEEPEETKEPPPAPNPRRRSKSGEFETVFGADGSSAAVVKQKQVLGEETQGEISPRPGRIKPVNTAVLRQVDLGSSRRSLLTPFTSAFLALVMAAVVGVVAFRLLAGHWPFVAPERPVARGVIMVESTPPGATVYLDRVKQQGPTPLTLERIQPGRPYELNLHLRGHAPWRQVVALGNQERQRTLRVTLHKVAVPFGTLKLGANVRADFYLDGRKVATQAREATLADVQAGSSHKLRVSAPGRRPVLMDVQVEPGKIKVLQFQLLKTTPK
jgi:serine/threonine protein kinase